MIKNSPTLAFLVIGSEGQVGSSLMQLLQSRSIPFLSLTTEEALDEAILSQFMEDNKGLKFVVNTMFEEPSEGLEVDYQQWIEAALYISAKALRSDQALLQLSSGLVYSGSSSRPYIETDEPDSQTDFGRSMISIEQLVQQANPKTVVLRSSWLFSDQRDNFLTRLVGAAISQETLSFSGSLRGCPTDSTAVAKALLAIAEQLDCGLENDSLWGIYHYVDSDACSMHTFAKTVITVVKSMAEVRVENIVEGDTPDMIDAVTGIENHELSCKKILSCFGIKQRPWRRSVHDVLKSKFSSQPLKVH